jgi:rare lipoprotein A
MMRSLAFCARSGRLIGFGLIAALSLSACASGGHGRPEAYRTANLRPYEVHGHRYAPRVVSHYDERGVASWYSYPAGQRRTATGEPFDGSKLTAAHKTLPLPCLVKVTNLDNGKSVTVRVNDRGPFVRGRIIDLSPAAAGKLGFRNKGLAHVRVKFLGPAPVADSGVILLAEADPDGAEPVEALF